MMSFDPPQGNGQPQSYYSEIRDKLSMQESHLQIVIWNLKLSIIDTSIGEEENNIQKLVCG